MKTTLVTVPCSLGQQLVIEEHLFNAAELVCIPGERARITQEVQKKYPGARVVSAHLKVEDAQWEVTAEVPE